MAKAEKSAKGKSKPAEPAAKKVEKKEGKERKKRLPRSLRKHVRQVKADLRREHAPAEAEKAIEQFVQRLRK